MGNRPPQVWLLAGFAVFVIAMFAAAGLWPSWLNDPAAWQEQATVPVGTAAVALLASDVVLPVPSSIVMIGNGAIFGFGLGTMLSLIGSSLGALLGYGLGRCFGRATSETSQSNSRLHALMQTHGPHLVLASRPVPVVAEVVSVLAGTTKMPLGRFVPATAVGSLVISAAYAAVGSGLVDGSVGGPVFGVVFVLSGLLWWQGRRVAMADDRSIPDDEDAEDSDARHH